MTLKSKITLRASGPLGPSRKGRGFGTYWNNAHSGLAGPVTCEICGTKHPAIGCHDTYITSNFLGRTVVEECCGAILDMVYAESGEVFVGAFIEEFSENPTGGRFSWFAMFLADSLVKAKEVLSKTGKKVDTAIKNVMANQGQAE